MEHAARESDNQCPAVRAQFRARYQNTKNMKNNNISHATLSYEVSQLAEKKQLREAYKLLPDANTVPTCIDRMQRCMSSMLSSMSELADLMNENREELEQDWTQGEVQAFLAGAWQGEFWQPLYDGTDNYERCKIIGIKVITQVEPGVCTYGLDNNIETFETDLEDLRLDCPNDQTVPTAGALGASE